MKLKVSSAKPGLSPPDDVNDPEEKEVSEDDDDDRNHKHRRQDSHSQSLERDALGPVFSRPYIKRNKPFDNGNPYQKGDSWTSDTWRNYHNGRQGNDLSASLNKQLPSLSFSAPLDSRIRSSLSVGNNSGPGRGRGRGREPGFWSQCDTRFGSAEVASQLVQHGSRPSSLFAGRGVPNDAQSTSWNAFGMIPTQPNGGLNTLQPLGFQRTFLQSINPPMNAGILQQRCRDFEERGFCLRGDMCPMEHGINHIVVEDVQSLSQFNLPISLPSAHFLGTNGQGPLPEVSIPSCSLMTGKGRHYKSRNPGINDDGIGLNGTLFHDSVTAGADGYDPDQPLWADNGHETSAAPLPQTPTAVDETSDHLHLRLSDGFDSERPLGSVGIAAKSQGGPLGRGRTDSSENRLEVKEKIGSARSSAAHPENEAKGYQESLINAHGACQGKRINTNDIGYQVMESSLRPKVESGGNVRKPLQKALRTLFVNGIPQKENKREALLLHFQKFGEVIDIYIPLNSERAFVQFSKREDAEAALKAPDAVMGNRFIKLRWANRDRIPDEGIGGGNDVPTTPSCALASVAPNPFGGIKVKDYPQSAAVKRNIFKSSAYTVPPSGRPKVMVASGPKAPTPSQRKLENLELLKEQIRKKQEMLDLKRTEFRRQLDRLEKQSTGIKDEEVLDPASKRHKVNDSPPAETSKATRTSTVSMPQQAEGTADHGPKSSSKVVTPESLTSKPSICPLACLEIPSTMDMFKLDNNPTSFKIIPPLPSGLANVALLKEHFSSYGDLSSVELEESEQEDGNNESETSVSACIRFSTCVAAEKAFLEGKCWQGHNLQFMWLTTNNSSDKEIVCEENASASPKQLSDTDVQLDREVTATAPKKEDVTRNVEFDGDMEKRDSDPDNMDPGDRGSSSASVSSGKLSP